MDGHPAPKRRLQLELDAGLVERAERLSPDLAGTVEALLSAHVAAAEAGHATPKARAEDHARFTAAFIAEHGRWGEEFSTL